MADFFHLGNRRLIPLRDVSTVVPYSKEYVARLARDGKVAAVQVNRQWYIDAESLQNFVTQAKLEVQARSEYVRALRKEELDLHEWWSRFIAHQEGRSRQRVSRSLGKTVVVIILGLLVGLVVVNTAQTVSPETLARLIPHNQFAALLATPEALNEPTYETGSVSTVEAMPVIDMEIVTVPASTEISTATSTATSTLLMEDEVLSEDNQ